MVKEKKTKRVLQYKILMVFVLFLLLLGTAIIFTISSLYRNAMEDYYSDYAFSQAGVIAEYVDGDKLEEYYALSNQGKPSSEIKDDYYFEVQKYLQMASEKIGAEYAYIVVPEDDVHVYVWDSGTGDEVCEIGDEEEYYGDGNAVMHAAFNIDAERTILITNNDVYGYLASAYVPILNSKGVPVGLSSIDVSMDMINQNIRKFVTISGTVEVIILLIAGIAYAIYVEKTIIKPVDVLKDATVRIRDTDIEKIADVEVKLNTHDEFEELGNAFTYMTSKLSDSIKKLQTVTAEKERIGAELDVARDIQSSMLPCIFPAFPNRDEFDIYASMLAAKEVGGDFYDFFMVDEKHLALVVADVSGKGVPAALFMVIGKTLIKDHTTPDADLGEVFTKVNNLLCESNSEGLFITAFEIVINLETGDVRYVNAGHEMPIVAKKGQPFEAIKIKPGFVLAAMEGIEYKEVHDKIDVGDRIFLYTDGVPEATNANGELFNMERTVEAVNKHTELKPDELLPAIKQEVDNFVGEAPQFDDITMLCFEYKKQMK